MKKVPFYFPLEATEKPFRRVLLASPLSKLPGFPVRMWRISVAAHLGFIFSSRLAYRIKGSTVTFKLYSI